MTIEVSNRVKVYEVDGKETPVGASVGMNVLSHALHNDRVVLEIDGKKHTVIARQLKAAIDNATNTGGI